MRASGIVSCMLPRHTTALVLLLGLSLPACSPVRAPQSAPAAAALDRLIAAHTAAAGGAAAIERIHSVEIGLTIVEPTYSVEATYLASRDRRMRIDVFLGGKRVYTEAFDGARAWDRGADDAHGLPKKAQATAALQHGIDGPGNLIGLHEAGRHGIAVARLAPETLDGSQYDVVEARFPDGFKTYYYLNRATHLIDRQRDQHALHPDIDPGEAWIEKRFSDFRAVDGRMFPFLEQQINLRTGAVLQTSTLRTVRVNVAVDPSQFVAP